VKCIVGNFNLRRRLAGGDPLLDQQIFPRDLFGHLPRRTRENAGKIRSRMWSLNRGYVRWWNSGCWCFLMPPTGGVFPCFFLNLVGFHMCLHLDVPRVEVIFHLLCPFCFPFYFRMGKLVFEFRRAYCEFIPIDGEG